MTKIPNVVERRTTDTRNMLLKRKITIKYYNINVTTAIGRSKSIATERDSCRGDFGMLLRITNEQIFSVRWIYTETI